MDHIQRHQNPTKFN